MPSDAYRYQFSENVDLRDVEDTLLLSVLAVEGIHGEARVRMDAHYEVDKAVRTVAIDSRTEVGRHLNAVFTSFVIREFGPGAFSLQRSEGLLAGEVRS